MGDELLPFLGRGAAIAVGGASLLLAVSILGACLERSGTAPQLGRALMRCSPRMTRQIAVAVAAVALPFASATAAGAAETPVRTWLSGAAATPTATTAPLAPAPVVREGDVERRTPPPSLSSSTTATAAPTTSPVPPMVAPPPTGDSPTALGAASTYVVRPGDSLWSITAQRLGPDASNRSVDRGWRVVYDANRDRVGPDPGLIHPGLVLTLPPFDAQP